jgi:hypothetical protein
VTFTVAPCINNSPTSPTLYLYYFLLAAALELINKVLAAENNLRTEKKSKETNGWKPEP